MTWEPKMTSLNDKPNRNKPGTYVLIDTLYYASYISKQIAYYVQLVKVTIITFNKLLGDEAPCEIGPVLLPSSS